jgi:hypothetical protein
MEQGQHDTPARRRVFWLIMIVAAVTVAVQVLQGPPGSGYGWGSVVVSSLLLVVPMVALALMVRSGERRYGWPAVGLAVLLVVVVLLALADNWSGQSASSRALDSIVAILVLVTAVGVLLVQLPLLRRTGERPASRLR